MTVLFKEWPRYFENDCAILRQALLFREWLYCFENGGVIEFHLPWIETGTQPHSGAPALPYERDTLQVINRNPQSRAIIQIRECIK
jgi:hypothetical protein